jgi:hypothetical protein
MQTSIGQGPWWAALTVWVEVNAVNLLQSAGFLSRVLIGGMGVNHVLGYGMMVPPALTLRQSYASKEKIL